MHLSAVLQTDSLVASERLKRQDRVEKIRDYMATLPNATWKGTRTNLAKRVGGTHACTMAALVDLVSTGQLVETIKSRSTEDIRWVGP